MQAENPAGVHRLPQEVRSMKSEEVVVHCVYAQEGESLMQLLEAAFRRYVTQVLAQDEGEKDGA